MIELNAASSSPNSAALSGPSIELRKRKVVPRASTLLADAKLNLTRADSAFGLCNAPVCRVESSARSKGSGIVDYLKLLKNNHFLEYRIAKKIRRSATFDRSHFRSTHPTFSKAAFAVDAHVGDGVEPDLCGRVDRAERRCIILLARARWRHTSFSRRAARNMRRRRST
jgi:hypothetical protein